MAVIKAVQSGTISFTAADSTKTATITAITTSKSCLFFTLSGNASSESRDNIVRSNITNSTTLTFVRNAASSTVQVEWFIVEFSSGVAAQQGYQAAVGTTTNVTITALTVAKSWSMFSQENDSYGFDDTMPTSHIITSSTNLRLQRSGTVTTCNANWQVIEYDNASVQQVSKALAAGDTTNTSTITAVTTAKTFLCFSYQATSSTASCEPRNSWICDLTNTTTMTYDRNTGNQAHTTQSYVVSISDNIAVQRARKALAAGVSSGTATITAVTLSKTHVHSLNFEGMMLTDYNGGDEYEMDMAGIKIKFNSTTQLSFARNASSLYAATASWETVEWASGGRTPDFMPFM